MRPVRSILLLLGSSLMLSGCGTLAGYYNSLRVGDTYILILIGALVVMFGLFGTITRSREEILNDTVIKSQRHKEALHAAEDEIRQKRDGLYRAQQELLGTYDRVLTEKQRANPDLQKRKRKLLELEREILQAENKRNQLQKNPPSGT